MAEPRDCVLFATADWATAYWTNKQHTAEHLARRGMRVLYVESVGLRAPTLNQKDLRRMWQRLWRGMSPPRQVREGVWVMSPLAVPFRQRAPGIRAINQGLLRLRLRRFLLRHGFENPLFWTYHPFMLEAMAGLPRSKVVYHCVDDLSAVPGVDGPGFRAEERRLLEICDVVFTTSETLRERCAVANHNTHYLPNVADAEHFAQARREGALPAELSGIPRPRIGYVGVLSEFKVDLELLLGVTALRPDLHWVLIGEEPEGQASPLLRQLEARPNVHLLGCRPYAELPDYLRGLDVGTLPTRLNDYTRSMFPLKYFEYLAAGLPVVATPLAFTRSYAAGLAVGSGADAFADALRTQLARGRLTEAEARAFVGDHTWERRLDKMLNLL